MSTEPDVMGPSELMQHIGLKKSRFHLLQKRGAFRHLEIKRPFGPKRYSRALVEQLVNGESTSQYGRRRL